MLITNMFSHPAQVCMSYNEHAGLAFNFTGLFLKGAFFSLIHAVLPDLFKDTTTNINKQITYLLENKGCHH